MGAVLYVTQPGASVHRTQERLRVMQGRTLLQEVRLDQIERVVVLSGAAGITAHAATGLMEAGIETAYLSSSGSFRGWLSPARGRQVTLRLAQFAAYSTPARRLELAQSIVAQKIRNADTLLARFARNHADFLPEAERSRLARAQAAVAKMTSIESLLGHEGEAAAAYFQAFGRMLRNDFAFTVRSRRPPRNPANALLSFAYTLLIAEATSAVAGAGLDPALGMLHTPEDGRPSLGLDLTEEFRQAVGDRVTLALTNNRILAATADFMTTPEGGVLLKPEARRRFLLAYEARMTEPFALREGQAPTTLRQCVRAQAGVLAQAIREGSVYRPFVLR